MSEINKTQIEKKTKKIIENIIQGYSKKYNDFYLFFDYDKIYIFLRNLIDIKLSKLKKEISSLFEINIEIIFYDIEKHSTKLKILKYHNRKERKDNAKKKNVKRKLLKKQTKEAITLKYEKYSTIFKEMGIKQKSRDIFETEEYKFNIKTSKAFHKGWKKYFSLNTIIKKLKGELCDE